MINLYIPLIISALLLQISTPASSSDMPECEGPNILLDLWHECFGSATKSGGEVYTGEWLRGLEHGYGTQVWPDGSVYVGEWKSGYMHGFGVRTWPQGTYYEGEWAEGMRHGIGIMTYGELFFVEPKDGLWVRDRFEATQAELKAEREKIAAQLRAEKEAEAKRQAELAELEAKRLEQERAEKAAREARQRAEAEEQKRIEEEQIFADLQRSEDQLRKEDEARRKREEWEAGAPERAIKQKIYDNCIIDLMPVTGVPSSLQTSIMNKCSRISQDPSFFERFKYGVLF